MPERAFVDTLVEPAFATQRAVATRGEEARHDSVAGLESLHLGTDLFDHADELVAQNRARVHGRVAMKDVEVGATHRAERDFDQRVGPSRHRWLGNLADLDVALALKGQSLHGVSPEGTCTCFASPLASAKLQTSRSGPSTPRALSTDRTCVRWSSA